MGVGDKPTLTASSRVGPGGGPNRCGPTPGPTWTVRGVGGRINGRGGDLCDHSREGLMPEGGGRHCIFKGRDPLPNYRPVCPLSLFLPPPPLFLRGIYHRRCLSPPPPPKKKKNILNTKLSLKMIQCLLNSFLYKECHVSNKIEGIETSIIS